MMGVTLVPGHTAPPSAKASSTRHECNRCDDLGFASSLGVAERTYYATERDVEHERRAAASPHHRRIGSSEPGVVGQKVVMQTGELSCSSIVYDIEKSHLRVAILVPCIPLLSTKA